MHHPADDPHFRFKTHQNFRNLSNNLILSKNPQILKWFSQEAKQEKSQLDTSDLSLPKDRGKTRLLRRVREIGNDILNLFSSKFCEIATLILAYNKSIFSSSLCIST